MSTFSNIKFLKDSVPNSTIFDYYYDIDTNEFTHWSTRLPDYSNDISILDSQIFNSIVISTIDFIRLTFLIECLVNMQHPILLVGNTGTGKTTLIKNFLKNNLGNDLLQTYISLNYFTDSFKLQQQLEKFIDKRSGKIYGPPATKRLIYYIDDLNLPYVETYGTQNALQLLRQHIDYKTIFDRTDLSFRKEITDVQYISSMNPTCGSFNIDERLQRHFSLFSSLMPSKDDLKRIYGTMLHLHFSAFHVSVQNICENLINTTIALHEDIISNFLPSATKFVYNWNMRELSNIIQGIILSKPEYYNTPVRIIKLWIHESYRVFSDRMINLEEIDKYTTRFIEVCKKHAPEFNVHQLIQQNASLGSSSSGSTSNTASNTASNEKTSDEINLYTKFCGISTGESNGGSNDQYLPMNSMTALRKIIHEQLDDYNSKYSMMDLVLFDSAIEHVVRICRTITNPGGNAMLIGVGGSGKQSLSRLASHISGFDVKQLSITTNFKVDDLKECLKEYFKLCGIQNIPIVFLITDTQIINEEFLIYINDILSSGWIPDIYEKEDLDALLNGLRTEAKNNGIPDTYDSLLDFFVLRLKLNFRLILCFSPVGNTFKIRARRFPGLINYTIIDWFHPWPHDALVRVATSFLEKNDEFISKDRQELCNSIGIHMANVHLSVTEISKLYYETQRRYNYVTPKSFLELISFYQDLLSSKKQEINRQITRLDDGLSTLRKTTADVAKLEIDLKQTMIKVAEKQASTDILLQQIGKEKVGAEIQQENANKEKAKAEEASDAAAKLASEAETELSAAKPAMDAAASAVDCLSKAALTELKSLPKPPAGVDQVTKACLILIEHEYKNHKWDRAKKMMNNIGQFLDNLKAFKGENIPEEDIERIGPLVKDPEFTADKMVSKSAAAANLCSWVVNIYTFNRIYVRVKPLMDSLEQAKNQKAEAEDTLNKAMAQVAEVVKRLDVLENNLKNATEEKLKVEQLKENCEQRIVLAGKLVNGLSSENERWGIEIEELRNNSIKVVGDTLLAAAFVSYIGAFDQQFRIKLWEKTWITDLIDKGIPLTNNVDPLKMITTEGKITKMQSEGLPADRISTENGAIINNCKRWPLIIDPQLQGIKWLREKEKEKNLYVIQFNSSQWIRRMEDAITNGHVIIIENIAEDLDPTLDPILARSIYKKGSSLYVKFSGEELQYDTNFKMYLQTKLANPHYRPEISAQCTLINFIATEIGLEDQLLQKALNKEQPELEKRKQELVYLSQKYKMDLLELEDQLLQRLANAPDDILSDIPLIESLEETKKKVNEISISVKQNQQTEITINETREIYRPVAAEGAMLYFLITTLSAIDHMYRYSLDSFVLFFFRSIERAAPADKQEERVSNLRESLRLTIFTWVSRGLFEQHKIIFLSQLTFNLMRRHILTEDMSVPEQHLQFLLRLPRKELSENQANPLDWLPLIQWKSVLALSELSEFNKLPSDLVEASSRFKEWYNLSSPEIEKLPLDWATLERTPFLKLLVVRCLRPDRMIFAMTECIRRALPNGNLYVDCDSVLNIQQVIDSSLNDSASNIPLYFILSSGSDVVGIVDKLAIKYGYDKNVTYHNVSMGQGQDIYAMDKLETSHRMGHWIILNNIHLMPRWLIELEKRLDEFNLEGSHSKFRLFLTSDPTNSIPIGILNRCIKLTNEPPSGLKSNLKRAFSSFSKEYIDEAEPKVKSILFGLCLFHAVMMERKMYGPLGFNMRYPFSLGDLHDSSVCLNNYLETSGGGKIPWADLKYIFGEIMYGGHIVNDFDRLVATTYLDFYMRDELLDEMELFPFISDDKTNNLSFMSIIPSNYERYLEYIDNELKTSSPAAFGLHPNAEINYRTTQSDNLFRTLMELQPRDISSGDNNMSPVDIAKNVLENIMTKLGEKKYDTDEIIKSLDEVGPYQNVFIQECDRMNTLLREIQRSLNELQLGLLGELTMTDNMESLQDSLFLDRVPSQWEKYSYPSLRALSSWLVNLDQRLQQLDEWIQQPTDIPKIIWLSGLVNPQSFLTAICQVSAQKNQLELDKLIIQTDITKRQISEIDSSSRDGVYIYGLSLMGARWDGTGNTIDKSLPREMFSVMPVINCKAILFEKLDLKGVYLCPCYKTEQRGPTYVFTAQIKSKSSPARWVLAGVALIMDVVS